MTDEGADVPVSDAARAAAAAVTDIFYSYPGFGANAGTPRQRDYMETDLALKMTVAHDPGRGHCQCAGCHATEYYHSAERMAAKGNEDYARWSQRMGDAFYLAYRSIHLDRPEPEQGAEITTPEAER